MSHEVIVNLIGPTTTEAGLRVQAALDPTANATGKQVSDEDLARVNLHPAEVHGHARHDVIKPKSNH